MRKRKANRHRLERRVGSAGVEFAVLAPFIVFLFLGMVELTRAVQVKHMLNDGVRSAARWAIQPGSTNSSVTQNAKDILTENGYQIKNVNVIIKINDKSGLDVKNSVTGDKISVQVTLPAAEVGWVGSTFLASNAIHSEKITMMRQR